MMGCLGKIFFQNSIAAQIFPRIPTAVQAEAEQLQPGTVLSFIWQISSLSASTFLRSNENHSVAPSSIFQNTSHFRGKQPLRKKETTFAEVLKTC